MGFFDDIGGAVSDIFGGIGALSEAKAYGKAAKIAFQNAQETEVSTKVQEVQQQREAYQVIGGQQSQVSGGGFAEGGSAGDLFRSSTQQSSLARGLINIQGQITEAGFLAQGSAFEGQQAAAKAKGGGGIFGGLLKIVGAVAPLFLG